MYTDLAIWVILLTRLFLDLRENTSSKEQGLIFIYMDMCVSLWWTLWKVFLFLQGWSGALTRWVFLSWSPQDSPLLINHSLHWNPIGASSKAGCSRLLSVTAQWDVRKWKIKESLGKLKNTPAWDAGAQSGLFFKEGISSLALFMINLMKVIWLARLYQNQKLETSSCDCSCRYYLEE